MKENISLIGMMGCGKTTISKALAELMPEYKSVDIDEEIEKSTDKKISEIFLKFGEAHFRLLESEKIKHFMGHKNQIVSLGGGAFENEENRKILLKNSTVIYLKTSAKEIFERIKHENHRPLLKNKNNSEERISNIMNLREKNYMKANIIVTTDNKTPVEISEEIAKIILKDNWSKND